MKLTERLVSLMIMAGKTCGMSDPERTISFIEEQLTSPECDAVLGFFKWLVANNRTFGHGNVYQVWDEYLKSTGKKKKKAKADSFGPLGTQLKPLALDPVQQTLIELGYKCCERGMNIQETLQHCSGILEQA
jgi:hypothetical protein